MPLIVVHNWPGVNDPSTGAPDLNVERPRKDRLAGHLRAACVSAKVPGISGKELVTVTFGGRQVIASDKTLVILVEILFHDQERTLEVRRRLAQVLGEAAMNILLDGWTVEVAVKRFDPGTDGFWTSAQDD